MMNNEPTALREVHEIRSKMWKDLRHLSPEERAEYVNEKGRETLKKLGLVNIKKI